jgi:hypothetical protein
VIELRVSVTEAVRAANPERATVPRFAADRTLDDGHAASAEKTERHEQAAAQGKPYSHDPIFADGYANRYNALGFGSVVHHR